MRNEENEHENNSNSDLGCYCIGCRSYVLYSFSISDCVANELKVASTSDVPFKWLSVPMTYEVNGCRRSSNATWYFYIYL